MDRPGDPTRLPRRGFFATIAAAMADESTIRTPAAPLRRPSAARRLALTVIAHPEPRRVGDLALVSGTTRVSRLEPELGPPGGAPEPLADRHLSRRPFTIEEH